MPTTNTLAFDDKLTPLAVSPALTHGVKCACDLRPCESRPWLAEIRGRIHVERALSRRSLSAILGTMFFFVGLLIGLNLLVRIAIGEIRELHAKGQTASDGRLRLSPRDVMVIAYRGGLFLLGSVAIGFALDILFDTTITDLFG